MVVIPTIVLLNVLPFFIFRSFCFYFSLGVEPVDKDVMKRPPRKASKPMITKFLIFQVISSACLIVLGTLFIFWREVKAVLFS